jgi:hypothetical protein
VLSSFSVDGAAHLRARRRRCGPRGGRRPFPHHHAATDAWIQRVLPCVRGCTVETARRIADDDTADPAPLAAELELLLGRVRMSVALLVHRLNPLRARKARARRAPLLTA